jgi:hypothetical protein
MESPRISAIRLWFPLAAAPAAWAAQGLLGWYVASLACPDDPAQGAVLSIGAARLLVGIVTAIALAITGTSLAVSIASWRSLATAGGNGVRERLEYVSLLAVAVTTMLTIALVWAGLPALLSRGCGAGR